VVTERTRSSICLLFVGSSTGQAQRNPDRRARDHQTAHGSEAFDRVRRVAAPTPIGPRPGLRRISAGSELAAAARSAKISLRCLASSASPSHCVGQNEPTSGWPHRRLSMSRNSSGCAAFDAVKSVECPRDRYQSLVNSVSERVRDGRFWKVWCNVGSIETSVGYICQHSP
jgi:hypothetical protein